jgi:type II secretory pathway predicted ATPase ExeA
VIFGKGTATDVDEICPHLGVPTDKDIRYGYPNALNVCYADLPGWSAFRPVDLPHQRQFCTTPNYFACPNYAHQTAEGRRNGRNRPAKTYLEFFGLDEEPFSIVPQPRFLVQSAGQQQAHDSLRWLLEQRQGLGILLGPVGSGKTLLCHKLSEELRSEPQTVVAALLTPSLHSEYALMADILTAWKIIPRRRRSLRDLEIVAHHFLVQSALERQQTLVLIIDEAQTLSRRCMQQVCKLLNWQDGGEQLLQVILVGQPSLQRKLARVPALRDRAVIEMMLSEMTPLDTQKMITTRLKRAGRRGDLFAPSAIQAIYQYAAGMPRRITILCQLCLWLAYREGVRYISAEVAQSVIEQVRGKDIFAKPEGTTLQLAAGLSLSGTDGSDAPLPRLVEWVRTRVLP